MRRYHTDLVTPEGRLLERAVYAANGCVEWAGSHDQDGYGFISLAGKQYRPHRLAYTLTKGPIPSGMLVCHTCDNPKCFKPSHLFLGTNADNMRDMASKGRAHKQGNTRCPAGHEYNAANTCIRKTGKKQCRECTRLAGIKFRARNPRARTFPFNPQQNPGMNTPRLGCINGHQFTPENTSYAYGVRRCITCAKACECRSYENRKARALKERAS